MSGATAAAAAANSSDRSSLMDEPAFSLSISNLLCQEDKADLDSAIDSPVPREEDDDQLDRALFLQLLGDTALFDDEYVERLISREGSLETTQQSVHDLPEKNAWFKLARSDAIRWFLSTKSCFGFSVRTAYLAVTYFDRFFARRRIDSGQKWAIWLLAIACLSVAAKMEERREPAVTEFHTEGFAFDGNAVRRMELLLLDTLQWRMNSVTPFDYLSYFISKLRCDISSSPEESLLGKAVESIFTAIKEINLVTSQSSAIAAAAIFAASSKIYTKEVLETKMNNTAVFKSISDKDHVYSCYKIMAQDQSKNSKRSASSDEASDNCSSVTYATDGASLMSFSRNKRRRFHVPSISWSHTKP